MDAGLASQGIPQATGDDPPGAGMTGRDVALGTRAKPTVKDRIPAPMHP